jgi:hypothetical protein
MNASADRSTRRTTTGCVALLATIAGIVSYLHMHLLVELHGQPGWVAALTPLMLLLVSSGGLVAEPLLAAVEVGSVPSLASELRLPECGLALRN